MARAVEVSAVASRQDNVELVKQVYRAFNRRDPDALIELVSSDFSFRSEFGAVSGRRYEGRAGYRQYLQEMAETWSAFRIELDDAVTWGDAVVTTYREHGIGRTSGVEIEARGYEVWHFRDGLAVRLDNYASKEQALAAALDWRD
jgi:ketosteroid isomerase-like protein